MKKYIAFIVFAFLANVVSAQEMEIPVHDKVEINSFWSNWYFSLGADFNAAYTSQENYSNKNPFSSDRGAMGFDLSLGKWFTPSIGLRTNFEIGWAKRVVSNEIHHSYKHWNLHEDVTFNLSNMLFGYNEMRVWNFIPYIGIGVGRNWTNSNYDITYNVGLLNNFRLSSHFSLFVDVYANAKEGSFDAASDDDWAKYSKTSMRHWDKLIGVSVGVTYNIGKAKWKKVPDVEALIAMNKEQMEALNASLKDQQDENARLRELLEKKETNKVTVDTVVERLCPVPVSVFFNIGSSKVASRKDLVNVKEVAEYAKQTGRKVIVTGYADSRTGSVDFNQKLSQKRAEVVAEELVKMGVSRDQMEIKAKGGVDDIAPFSYNRRVTVMIND